MATKTATASGANLSKNNPAAKATKAGGGRSQPTSEINSLRGDAAEESDENYNLISVLYHTLQAAQTSAQYARDASQAGDQELVDYFNEYRSTQLELAQQAKSLLSERLGNDLNDDDDEDDEE